MATKKKQEESQELPIMTTLGFKKQGGLWYVIELKTQGDKVVDVKLSEGDTKAIALEAFKIKAANSFLNIEE